MLLVRWKGEAAGVRYGSCGGRVLAGFWGWRMRLRIAKITVAEAATEIVTTMAIMVMTVTSSRAMLFLCIELAYDVYKN